jgi:hypothetical protein
LFRDACRVVRGFTRPLIAVFLRVDGRLTTSNGAMIFVNEDGWFLTAAHLFDPYNKAVRDAPLLREHANARRNIELNPTLDAKHKRKKIEKLQFDPEWIEWVGFYCIPEIGQPPQPLATKALHVYPSHDLAIGQLAAFNSGSVPNYPVFKRLPKGEEDGVVGASLCRMGFPFAKIEMSSNNVVDGILDVSLNVAEMTFFSMTASSPDSKRSSLR